MKREATIWGFGLFGALAFRFGRCCARVVERTSRTGNGRQGGFGNYYHGASFWGDGGVKMEGEAREPGVNSKVAEERMKCVNGALNVPEGQ